MLVQSKTQINKKFTISAPNFKETVICNAKGEAEVSEQAADLLVTKYAFKEFQKVEEGEKIEKVEVPTPIQEDAGEELKQPDIDPVEPSEVEVEEEMPEDVVDEESNDQELIELIESIEKIDELKEIAKDLDLPEDEWGIYKRKDYFKKYLIEKLNEEAEEEEA